ncbi:MAG: DUF5807 family protein [Halobacteriaceae archaeon]
MSRTPLDEFLAGERPREVALYLADEQIEDPETLTELGRATRTDDGTVLIVPGDQGRGVVSRLTGRDVMEFAQDAGDTRATVDRSLTGGACPEAGERHPASFVFAFVEAQNEEVGDLYAEGPVVHAYVACSCGATYSERWVVDD